MNLFKDHGLSKLINARGPATLVGANRVSRQVMEYMESVLSEPVEMRQLQELASEVISKHTGAEAGCVTGCAAAGIAIGVASFLSKDDLAKITSLPKPISGPHKIVIQKAHMISGGGCSIEQLILLSGAEIVEVGESADCAFFQLHAALDDSVAGAVFVMGGRSNTPGTIPLGTFIAICHEHNIPVIVDAASEVNISHFIESGADLVIVSSQKWLGGPTAGLIAGRSDLVHACFLTGEFGIGRPMKAGKEGIAGLIGALETYAARNNLEKRVREKTIIEHMYSLLNGEPGISLEIMNYRSESPSSCFLRIHVDPEIANLPAWEINKRMLQGSPRIALDVHRASEGFVEIDPGLLDVEDEEFIADRLKEILAEARVLKTDHIEYIPRFEESVRRMKDWREEYPVMK